MSRTITVVDDDPEMISLLKLILEREGYKVAGYETAGRFIDSFEKNKPDLCVIDIQLAGMDGRELIRVLRANEKNSRTPVIAMSAAATSPADMIRGLDNGADEYLAKPLDMQLLLVRVKNLIERSGGPAARPATPVVTWKKLELFPDEHRVTWDGKDVKLTHMEFKLLQTFLGNPERVLARSWLLQTVWGSSPDVSTRTVDKHVETLRKKLPELGERIETMIRIGYVFRA